MNDNITGRKDWMFEPSHMLGDGDGPVTVILEEGRRLIKTKLNCCNYPLYYIQKPYVNHVTGRGHWVDVHYDRLKNKMIRRFKNVI